MKSHRAVSYDIDPSTPEPYNRYIMGRNEQIAKAIAKILGVSTVLSGSGIADDSCYQIPSSTITLSEAERRGVRSVDDLYGVAIGVNDIPGSKVSLHRVIGSSPHGYSRSVANSLTERGLVLPGYSVFNIESAQLAFQALHNDDYSVRLKDPRQSDSGGQWVVECETDLLDVLQRLPELGTHGVVLESNLSDTSTLSMGSVIIDGVCYSFLARQFDVKHLGKTRFGGGQVTFYQCELSDLADNVDDEYLKVAIEKASSAHDVFSQYEPIASRFSYDVLTGVASNGNMLSGVSDQTFRVGGYTPAEVLAIERLHSTANIKGANLDSVTALVRLIYDPTDDDRESAHIIFLDVAELMIVANLVDTGVHGSMQ
jgi:hypothetical protein